MINWKKVREGFPGIEGYVYLNCASRGPIPERTVSLMKRLYDGLVTEELKGYHHYPARLWQVRKLIAKMLHTDAGRISLSTNTSMPINMVAQGMPWKRGDVVLLGDNEFPANVYPWLHLEKRGVNVKFIASANGIVTLDDFEKAWTKRTRAIAVSFVNYHNGFKNDLASLAALCHSHDGFLLVDGIQGVGVNEIDVEKSGIDFISGGGAKWLLSPYGSGYMYVSDRLKPHLGMTFVNWLAAGVGREREGEYNFLLDFDPRYAENGRRFEIGTLPFFDLFGLGESLKLLLEIGVPVIEKRLKSLLDPLIYELHRKGVEIASLLIPEHRSTILSFRVKNWKKIIEMLGKKKIIVSSREGLIRVSPHIFNTESDIDKLILALK